MTQQHFVLISIPCQSAEEMLQAKEAVLFHLETLNPEFSAEGTIITVKVIPLDPQLFLPDDSVLAKRAEKVTATIYTKKPSAQLLLDIQKHNAQYPPISIIEFDRSHDRFLCIDETVYHLGASIKDLGKKWFAFNRMEISTTELLQQIK